jgi:hypothetical protein
MNSRLLSARYSMVADFYEQRRTVTEAGQVRRDWDRANPLVVQNLTEGVLVRGVRGTPITEEWTKDYEPQERVKMFIASSVIDSDPISPVRLTRRFRVSNIRDRSTNNVLWFNDNGEPLEFNIEGITPINDPFGRIVEYELLLRGIVARGG